MKTLELEVLSSGTSSIWIFWTEAIDEKLVNTAKSLKANTTWESEVKNSKLMIENEGSLEGWVELVLPVIGGTLIRLILKSNLLLVVLVSQDHPEILMLIFKVLLGMVKEIPPVEMVVELVNNNSSKIKTAGELVKYLVNWVSRTFELLPT